MKEKIIASIKQMNITEVMELVKSLEEEFGISAISFTAPTQIVSPIDAIETNEEKVSFEVNLTDFGAKKIEVIKAIRVLIALDLREAKEFVESAPVLVKEGLTKEEAEEMKAVLEKAGATVTII